VASPSEPSTTAQKVKELRALAASASTDQSRDQLTTLSHQFEQLAECEDILNTRVKLQTDPLPAREARTAPDVDRRPYPSAALPEMGST
jgi:hypothetical protein